MWEGHLWGTVWLLPEICIVRVFEAGACFGTELCLAPSKTYSILDVKELNTRLRARQWHAFSNCQDGKHWNQFLSGV